MTVERQRYRLPNRKTKRTRSDSVGETARGNREQQELNRKILRKQ